MINKTERLLYVPFTYSKDDVSAVTFNMQVLILKLLMPWGIPRSTRDHKTHFFVVRLPSSQRKSFRRGSVFKGRKPSCTVTKRTNKLHLVFTNRLRVQEAAHNRSRIHSCFSARAPGEGLPSLLSFSVVRKTLKQIHVPLRIHRYHTTF